MKLTGKKALITGGNSGLGLAGARPYHSVFSETLARRTASDTRGKSAWLRWL